MTPRRQSRGFSLVEILLAVALLGALLLSLNVFIFSMSEIWGQNADKRLFEQHVRAVTRHVDRLLRRAALSPVALAAATGSAVAPQETKLETGATEAALTFELPAGDRVLPWPDGPLPDVVCSLSAQEGKGLILYWHSRLETRFADDAPRPLVLTPLVTALSYDYYNPDFKNWQNQPRLQKDGAGKYVMPDRIRLRFALNKMTAETVITLPATTGALPAF
ncbi:MAG: prepilin-type N-terminal cleavage/methylation domain-containing protein [Opitutae bacterium]|nr:prepilin-type N-terminal cleavage/methylation domain-containing protein [Opitutae bacterium]